MHDYSHIPSDAAGIAAFAAQVDTKIVTSTADAEAPPYPDYHWTPANQRRFLEELAICGNISASAKIVRMSNQAAYAFRQRSAGILFKMAWDAAALLARARLSDELFERAMEGQTEIYERDPGTGRITRMRKNNMLGMAVLKRLDGMALGQNAVPADTAIAQIISGDFEAFLDLITEDGDHEDKILAASMYLIERAGEMPVIQLWPAQFARHYQLALETAALADAQAIANSPKAAPTPSPRVWQCTHHKQLRTNFPPPVHFSGSYEGRYGEGFYARTLTYDESDIFSEITELEQAPRRAADAAARDQFFAAKAAEAVRLRAGIAVKE